MANGKLVNIVNSVHRRSYMAGDRLRRSRCARGGLGFTLAWERRRRGFSLLPWPPYKAPTPSSLFFLRPLFFPTLPIISGELASSPQCRCHLGKGHSNSVFFLHIHPANCGRLISPRIRCLRPSSSWPATSPPWACRRGQGSPVSRCP